MTLLGGMALIGLTTFLPLYVQGVMRHSALVAGFTLTAMVLGWPVGATIAGRNMTRFGLRRILVFGAALLPAGAVVFLLLGPGSSPLLAGAGSFVMGFGMGFLNSSASMIVQGNVGWAQRGAATASAIFSRILGSTLGATILGVVLTTGLAGHGGVEIGEIRQLLERPAGMAVDAAVQAALGHALHLTFWAVFAISVLTFAFANLVPRAAAAQALRG